MAVSYIRPTSGLSTADKETARQWMVEGHEILHGKVAGTIPMQDDCDKVVPMYSTEPLILPPGYYPYQIKVTPTYNPGTVVTNFSAAGPFGSYVTWGNLNSCVVKDGQIYLKTSQRNDQDHTVSGSSAGITFQLPVASGFKTAIFTATGDYDTQVGFTSRPNVTNNVLSSGTLNGSVSLNGNLYISIRLLIRWVDAWNTSTADVNITKITFYP